MTTNIGFPQYQPNYQHYYDSRKTWVSPAAQLWVDNKLTSIARPFALSKPVASAIGILGLLGQTGYTTYSEHQRQVAEKKAKEFAKKQKELHYATKKQYYEIKGEHLLREIEANESKHIEYHPTMEHLPIEPRDYPAHRGIISQERLIESVEGSPIRGRRRSSSKGKSPERPRTHAEPEIDDILPLDMPRYEFEVPQTIRKRRFVGNEITAAERDADQVLRAIKRSGYTAAMNDPIVKQQSTYYMFTPEGMRDAVLDTEVYVPKVVRAIGPEGLVERMLHTKIAGKTRNPPKSRKTQFSPTRREATRASITKTQYLNEIKQGIKLQQPFISESALEQLAMSRYKKIFENK